MLTLISLDGSPYLLEPTSEERLLNEISGLEDRVLLLRENRILTPDTLDRYYGRKRFEYVAESNALEGSTLSTGETELAVLKGVTLTGHDPGYVRDAIDLDRALQSLTGLARHNQPVDISQVKGIHELILGERPGAGLFRKERVRISGSKHTPPKTWEEIMNGMEAWERWSLQNNDLPAIIRATVLHAWLVHIHPFIDGNGRTARAVTTLELIRAGYPPIVIRRKERTRYCAALALSDDAGNLADVFDLFVAREENALRSLELAAKEAEGYDPFIERIKKVQLQKLKIWDISVTLLARIIEHSLSAIVEKVSGRCEVQMFSDSLDIDDYFDLCDGRSVSKTWSFTVSLSIPGLGEQSWLAWQGFRSYEMKDTMRTLDQGGPSLFWSVRNANGYPPWVKDASNTPVYQELSIVQGSGDYWYGKTTDGKIEQLGTAVIADKISRAMAETLFRLQS